MSELSLGEKTRLATTPADGDLPSALRAAEGSEGFSWALAWWPSGVGLLEVRSGELHGPDGKVELDQIYELRAFGDKTELRWQRTGSTGVGVVVRDIGAGDDAPGHVESGAHIERVHRLDGVRHLVWGTVDPQAPSEGWTRTVSTQVGALAVPTTVGHNGQRLAIEAVEYVARDEHGNAEVVDELLGRWTDGGKDRRG